MELTGGIEVRITGATPLEVLARITAWGLRASSEPRVYALASQIMELENKLNAYDRDGSPAPTGPPADPPGPAAGEPGPSAAPTEETPELVPTAEEVRTKGIDASRKYGTGAIRSILQEFNASRITELAEKDRAAFIARLEGLGETDA